MSDKNFEIIRQIASKLGVASSESNDDIYNPLYLSSISRSIDRLFSQLQAAQAKIKELEQEVTKWKSAREKAMVEFDKKCKALNKLSHEYRKLEQAQEWIEIDSAEDVDSDTEVLLYDGCDYSIDYVDICVEYGNKFFANGSDGITHYKHLLPPQPKESE